MCSRLHTQHNTMSTVTHNSKLNTAQPTYRHVCHPSLTHSYQQAHGKSKPLADPRHRAIARSTASENNRCQQASKTSGISKASAVPRCQRTRTTVVHSCRMSGSRRGRLHIQHNTMSTVTHHSKLNTAQPTYRRVCHRILTYSYRLVQGKSKPSAGRGIELPPGPRHQRTIGVSKQAKGPA